jgi:hypothetical protein
MTDESTQGVETPALTWNDVYEHSKVIYQRLRKCSQRALAHHIAWDLAVASDVHGLKNVIEETLQKIKKNESTAKIERGNDRLERMNKEYKKLEANNWIKPRKKRRKKRVKPEATA